MSDPDTRDQRSRKRKRNIIAKVLFDPNEFRGAFSMRVIEDKKNDYRRKKLKPKDVDHLEEE